MSYHGLGQDSSASDLTPWRRDLAVAREADIPVPALRSIRTVESGSNPSVIRFEPHLFWRMRKGLSGGADGRAIRAAMTAEDMATVPYTPGYEGCRISRAASCVGSETNRAAFERAFRVDPRIAVKATSWGSYQVLGSHLLSMYPDPQSAVREFDANPQIVSERLLAAWMRANPRAQAAARASNWGELAHRYNGCSDCSSYVSRLTTAHARHQPEWERVRSAVEAAGPLVLGAIRRTPAWVPWTVAGVVGVGVLGGTYWWLRSRRRRAS